jgi:hypothetical protein
VLGPLQNAVVSANDGPPATVYARTWNPDARNRAATWSATALNTDAQCEHAGLGGLVRAARSSWSRRHDHLEGDA